MTGTVWVGSAVARAALSRATSTLRVQVGRRPVHHPPAVRLAEREGALVGPLPQGTQRHPGRVRGGCFAIVCVHRTESEGGRARRQGSPGRGTGRRSRRGRIARPTGRRVISLPPCGEEGARSRIRFGAAGTSS